MSQKHQDENQQDNPQGSAEPSVDAASVAAAMNPAHVELEQLQEQLTQARDQALRSQAEMHNIRRRAEKDVENAHKYALDKFAGDLLAVVDNLERALGSIDAADERMKSIGEGVALTHRSFVDALRRHGLEQLDPRGETFNPEHHEAVAMVPNPQAAPNSIIDVMQKGYTLNGRLLRAAMVVVAKA